MPRSIARLKIDLGCPCAVTALPVGPDGLPSLSARWRSNVLVGQVDKPLCRLEAVLRVLRLRRIERTAVERLLERCVDVAGMALDLGAIPRP